MFYSEQLLRKDGPLAYVWLAANMERKLSRSQFLKTDINDSVEAIVDNNGAPLALRLSGQLLLGVVRIYSRKTVYLMEDCNEALLKLKMAFRSGNVDMERNTATVAKAQTLTLQNKVTDLDLLLLPEPNLDLGPEFPLLQRATTMISSQHISSLRDITLPDLDDTIDIGRGASRAHDLDELAGDADLDLGLDFAMDDDAALYTVPEEVGDATEGQIEIGLEAPTVDRSLGDELGIDTSMAIDMGLDDELGSPSSPNLGLELVGPATPATPTHDADILGDVSVAIDFGPDEALTERSLLGEDAAARAATENEGAEKAPPRRTRTVKRRAHVDDITEIRTSNSQIMENRKSIIREHWSLPADPTDFALMSLSTDSNKFVNSLYHPLRLHPELSRLVNPEFVSQMMKRKRSLTDIREEELDVAKAARLTSPAPSEGEQDDQNRFEDTQMDIEAFGAEDEGPLTGLGRMDEGGDFDDLDLPHISLVQDEEEEGQDENEEEDETGSATTTGSGTAGTGISRHTIKAASMLKENLIVPNDSAYFQTMLGPTPSKSTKVKMFFEMLVLATKDAVKLEQTEAFGNIEVTAKHHLFDSDWDAPAPASSVAATAAPTDAPVPVEAPTVTV